MSLVQYAEEELRAAGFFDEDSDYGGLIGPAVLEMITTRPLSGRCRNAARVV